MVPGPRMIEYPVILGGDTIQLLAYPVESAVAEKLQAMVALGAANSRMKDFYDVWICSKHLDFTTGTLLKAIEATFKNRETPCRPKNSTHSRRTSEGHRVQWNAFVRKMGEDTLIDAFDKVVVDLKVFALPALRAVARGEKLTQQWKASTGWAVS
jgi:hypothetical protein